MEIELLEIRDFLAAQHPFDQLPEPILALLPEKLEVRYFRRETAIPDTGSLNNHLYIVRSGAVELLGQDEELLARLSEGDVFGYLASHRKTQEQQHRGTAIEATLGYQLRAKDVDRL